MPKDIRGWSVVVGDTVAYAIKPGELVLGQVHPITAEFGTYGPTVRETYVRLKGPNGFVLRLAKDTVKVGEHT